MISSHKLWVSVVLGFCFIFIVVGINVRKQGEIAWQITSDTHIGHLDNPLQLDWVIFDKNFLYFNTDSGQTVAANQATGKIQWLREMDSPSPFPPVLIDDTTVAVLTLQSEVFAFDTLSGQTKWFFEPPEYRQPDTQLLVDATSLYFADRSGVLHALDKKSGQERWQAQFQTVPSTAFQSESQPLIHFGLMSQSDTFLFINHSPEKALITVDKTTGQRIKKISQPKFYYRAPDRSATGQPIMSDQPVMAANPQQYRVNGRAFFLCHNQTSLCTTEASGLRHISVSDFARQQQRWAHFKKWWPKLAQPVTVTSTSKSVVTNQPFDLEFELNTTNSNNLWESVTTEVQFTQAEKKLTLQAYPISQSRWRVTTKLPNVGEWRWQLHVATPNQTYFAKGKITVTEATPPDTYSWSGLGFQDALLDRNSNDDYLDQLIVGTTTQPPLRLDQSKIVNFQEYLDVYAHPATGFTAFRWSVDNFNFKVWQDISTQKFKLSLKGGQAGDSLVRTVAAHQLALDLDLFGFKPPFLQQNRLTRIQKQQLSQYLQYMVSRYGAYVTSWEIGNEVSPSDAWIIAVVELLKKLDPYKLPISINWERDNKLGLDFTSLHHYYSPSPALTQPEFLDLLKNHPYHPVFTELGNQTFSWDPESADRLRVRVWTAFMTQTPVFFWAQNGPLFHNEANNANIYLGPIEQQNLAFFRTQTVGQSPNWVKQTVISQNEKINLLALKNSKTIWVYAVSQKWGSAMQTTFNLPELQNQSITWFNPATGAIIQKTTIDKPTPFFTKDLVGRIDLEN